jgi:hypothetical protein
MRAILRGLALMLGVTAFLLVLLEIGVRLVLPHPQVIEVTTAEPEPGADPAGEELVETLELTQRIDEPGKLFVSTPTGRRLRPNKRAIVENNFLCQCTVEIRTNSLGYRNREIGEKNRTRVLFLGDSITLADYVQEHETWVRLVEKLSRPSYRPLETINAGVWAIGLANELAILLETGLQTNPDAVVLAWYLNDVQPSPGIQMIRPPAFLKWSQLGQYAYQGVSVLRSKLVVEEDYGNVQRPLRQKWAAEIAEKFPAGDKADSRTVEGFNRSINQQIGDWGSSWSDGAWEYMHPYFVELRRQADLHGFQLLFVAFPVLNQVNAPFVHDYPQQKFAEVAAELDVPMLDLLPLLRGAHQGWVEGGRKKPERMFYDWCHHTPHGNRLIAGWVHEFLQENLTP